MECIENYCQVCFTKMHQKGGLAKHHVKPILRKVKTKYRPAKCHGNGSVFAAVTMEIMILYLLFVFLQIKQVSPKKVNANLPTISLEAPTPSVNEERTEPSSLLEGTYDEESSAKSFQEALEEWRSGKSVTKEDALTGIQ